MTRRTPAGPRPPASETPRRRAPRERNRRKTDPTGLIRGLLVLVLAAQCVRVAFTSPRLRLQEVRVTGSSRYTPDDIVRMAGLEVGENIFRVNLVKVSERLRREPAVREASVARELPGTLRVEVHERVPALQVKVSGVLFDADEEGVLFQRAPARSGKLPLLELPAGDASSPGSTLGRDRLHIVETCVRLAVEQEIALHELRIDRTGELWLNVSDPATSRPKGLAVRAGRATELPEKFRDIRRALAGSSDLAGRATYLNVMCAGRPAYMPAREEGERDPEPASGG